MTLRVAFSGLEQSADYEFIVLAEEMCEIVGLSIMLVALLDIAAAKGQALPT